MATYRVSPQFIFAFIGAAILLAFFIHRYQVATSRGEISQSSTVQSQTEESIEEIPRDWQERVPAGKNENSKE